ncbi:MAG: acyl-CoA synthetase [Gammaproteobacteria bacterium]|nr:acyl-CoA synthetase [Gammaproteobacteria bacterium]
MIPTFKETFFPSARMREERRIDGTILATPELPLIEHLCNLPAELAARAAEHPEKTYLAERRGGPSAPWTYCSYAQMNVTVRAIAAWIVAQQIPRDRSLLILSGNSILHAAVKYGAMAARLPACPISVNYSLMGGDYGRLKHVIALVRPAIVFAEQSSMFKAALEAVDFGDSVLVTDDPAALGKTSFRRCVFTADVVATAAGGSVDASIRAIDADEPSIYMLTSGSTSLPKAVIQTQRMLASNLAQGRQVLGATAGWSDRMLDWLPWSHVSGAYTKMGTLTSGGSLFIDGGRPIPGRFDETLANLKELTPKFFINVPSGYAMLADALERDAELRLKFFKNLRLALYGGAGLPQPLYDRLQRLAVESVGHRIFFTAGYGATETTSGCMAIYFPTEEVGIGLPMPGLTMKLVPNADRYEVRLKGPMITPGYLNAEDERARMFDDEGFYRTGDAAVFNDPHDLGKGLKFAGRLSEEFKLGNGTWVTAGRLRDSLLGALSPLVRDLLICGENREWLSILVWPSQPLTDELRLSIGERLATFNVGRGASERIRRVGFLTEPPSVDAHEVSDKGSINQRVALARRAADVARLYTEPCAAEILTIAALSN